MRRIVVYIALLAVGSLFILAANVYKVLSDRRSAEEKRVAENDAKALAETRHQEMLAVVNAAKEQRETYVRAYEELKTSGPTVAVSSPERAEPALDLKRVDERVDRALREVAPAMVERLQHERKLSEAAIAADALAGKWDASLRPKFEAMVRVIHAGVMRAKAPGLFPALSLTYDNPVPQQLVLRSFGGERFVRLLTAHFDTAQTLSWEVQIARGYALVQQDQAPKQVQMPQLIVYVTDHDAKVIGASLDFDASGQQITANLVPQNVGAQKVLEKSRGSLKQLHGDDLILAWVGELLAATRLMEIQGK